MTHAFTEPKPSKDLAFVVGAWLADGTVGKDVAKLSKPDKIFVEAVKKSLEACGFPVRPRLYENHTKNGITMWQVTVCSIKACEFLRPHKYQTSYFRPLFAKFPFDLMSGFFSGDGSYYVDPLTQAARVSVSNNRKDVLETFHQFITVVMHLRPTALRQTKTGAWYFSINRKDEVPIFTGAVPLYKDTTYNEIEDAVE